VTQRPQINRAPEPADCEPALPWAALEARSHQFRTPCGDGEMVWHCWGEGPPLVLLHGGAGSWLHWVRTIPAFAGERMVVVPDIPGLGGSAPPPDPAPAAIAAVVLDGLQRVIGKGARFDIAGFSYGGVIAGFLATQTSATRSLTLVGSGGVGVPLHAVALERVRDKTGAEREAANRANLLRWMLAEPAGLDAQAVAIQDWNSRRARYDSRPIGNSALLPEQLRKLDITVAGIWGERDHAVHGKLQEVEAVLRAVQPKLDFRIVPAAGHWVAYDAPDAFASTLRGVLGPP
jgi:pimeloyl-ACP methyl ester carboxylesterase